MSIELIPAIDIIDGNVVRLTQGDYAQKTVYGTSPADVAQRFEQMGFHRLHVVDLDGAKSHHVVNVPALKEITTKTDLVVDFGGGIKTDDDIKQAFAAGAAMVTVGSIAVQQPSLFERWLQTYGQDRMILGADVRNGRISINGWLEDSEEELIPFLRRYVDMGVRNVLCTDISRDGMLNGPATELYRSVMQTFPQLNLIASGGVSSNADIEALHHAGIPAVVFGKAFYTGKLNIEQLWHLQNE
ncbi:MAG: 1-(5-phosphoribosyl)-5-[(5-phosphoribosylamino)methylideneamino]imidazole-4-carboxamide isomerase [Bacteroidales bacterium]|nr:1-(5-phosphoribosyl)-5-[(5-phosphoribosylamino)methylideneamino]imidazole-4-carboxamide isomerase [Bacteroidales bacterium]